MMSLGSLPSSWMVWFSPSSSVRQDWSIVQLSAAAVRHKKELQFRRVQSIIATVHFTFSFYQAVAIRSRFTKIHDAAY